MAPPNLVRVAVASVFSGAFFLQVLYSLGEGESHAQEVVPQEDLLPTSWQEACKFKPPENLTELVLESAQEFGLDPRILAVTVHRESGCDPWAYGAVGEIGLTQIFPKYWVSDLKKQKILTRAQELWDPRTNLRASAWILSTHLKRGKSKFEMFRRYNGRGPKARKYAQEQQQALWGIIQQARKSRIRVSGPPPRP